MCPYRVIQDNAHPPLLCRPHCYLYKYEGQKLKLQAQREFARSQMVIELLFSRSGRRRKKKKSQITSDTAGKTLLD